MLRMLLERSKGLMEDSIRLNPWPLTLPLPACGERWMKRRFLIGHNAGHGIFLRSADRLLSPLAGSGMVRGLGVSARARRKDRAS
jgi:hypothetical protein